MAIRDAVVVVVTVIRSAVGGTGRDGSLVLAVGF